MYDDSYHNSGNDYMMPTTYKWFEECLNIIESKPTNLRFHNFQIMKRSPELANNYTIPTIMDGFLKFALMFLGGEGSALNLHYNNGCSHLFLTHFQMQKVVFLYPWNQSELLYKLPYTKHSRVNVLKSDLKDILFLNQPKVLKWLSSTVKSCLFHNFGGILYIFRKKDSR